MHLQNFRNSAALLLAVTSASNAIPTKLARATNVKYVFNFGDSYSSTGFDINSTLPSGSNILGNPPFPGWTTANGNKQNWLDTLITEYNSSLTYAINLASGGATTDYDLVASYAPYPTVYSLINQVEEFASSLSPAPSGAPWVAESSLFSVWIGVNDVGNGWYESNWSDLVQDILNEYFTQVQALYDAGARKFLFLGVPPIYLTPAVIAQGNASQASIQSAIADYNDLLTSKASAFETANDEVTTWVFNTTDAFLGPINDPAAYGATNATCYSETGTECLWFNDYHPGQAIHDQVAKGVAQLIEDW